MSIFDTSMSDEHVKEHNMLDSIRKWNSPYSTMKSMANNFKLSFEQGKEAHYDRGDLPIVVLTAEDRIVSDSQEIAGVSVEEFRKGFDVLQKDLAGLSSNGKHVFVNGTNHGSIVTNDETADHILSLISNVESSNVESSKITADVKNPKTCPLSFNSRCFTGTITEIIDGDLIRVSNSRISLALVSAPELDEKTGIGSKAFVETLCPKGSEVLVDQDDLRPLDGIGGDSTPSAVVYCNGVNLNEALIKSQHEELRSGLCGVSEFADELWVREGCSE